MDFWTFVSTDKGRRFILIPNRTFEFIHIKINRIYIIKNSYAMIEHAASLLSEKRNGNAKYASRTKCSLYLPCIRITKRM